MSKPGKIKTETRLNLYLPQALYSAILRYAAKNEISASEVVRRAVKAHIDYEAPEQPPLLRRAEVKP